jgi:D-arabinose 1-dehydrogenase-like Zn-dependent alcohol dehydrogenase
VLAAILRVLQWGGAVAATGLVGGTGLETTVYPFITRNVAVVGIDSVDAPRSVRAEVWETLACALGDEMIERLVAEEIGLDGVAAALAVLDRGGARGRVLVDPARGVAQVAP